MTTLNSAVEVLGCIDLCGEISKYLPVIQTLILTRRSKWPFTISVRTEILRRLIEIGVDSSPAERLLLALLETKSVLSGSFLLAVLESAPVDPLEWRPNNIDVYSPVTTEPCTSCNTYSKCHSLFSAHLCREKAICTGLGQPYPLLKILESKTWVMPSAKINEVIIETGVALTPFVFDTFDFDFCKVTYDGERLAIFNPETVLKRDCTYTGDKEALKYFSSTDLTNGQRGDRLASTYRDRMRKYRERGFIITDVSTDPIHQFARRADDDTERFSKLADELEELLALPVFEYWENYGLDLGVCIGWTHTPSEMGWARGVLEACVGGVHPRSKKFKVLCDDAKSDAYTYELFWNTRSTGILFRLKLLQIPYRTNPNYLE